MCLICEPPQALREHPQYRRLCAAETLAVMILSGRRARPRQVCDYTIYCRFARAINAIVEATCPDRAVPVAGEHELERPDPAWSLAMSLHALVQDQRRLARAHCIVAARILNATPSHMEIHRDRS